MERNDFAFFSRKNITVGRPAGTAFSVFADKKPVLFQKFVKPADGWTGVPDDACSLRKRGEELFGLFKLGLICPSHGHNDLVDVGNLFDLLDDFFYGRGFQLRRGRGKNQGYGTEAVEFDQLIFHPLKVDFSEPVESSYHSGLIKVSHFALLYSSF